MTDNQNEHLDSEVLDEEENSNDKYFQTKWKRFKRLFSKISDEEAKKDDKSAPLRHVVVDIKALPTVPLEN